ncbi:MAG: hypothetical protein ACR2MW_11570 [Chthoniobacterales bacterium]
MNILDDPNLTAYALDELSGADKAAMETAIASSPAAQDFVREMRLLSGNLRAEYDAEREARPAAPRNIVPLPQKDEPWSVSRRLALAAAITLSACLGAIAISSMKRGAGNFAERSASQTGRIAATKAVHSSAVDAVESVSPMEEEPPPPPTESAEFAASSVQAFQPRPRAKVALAANGPVAKDAEFNTARYSHIIDSSFLAAKDNPLSTF